MDSRDLATPAVSRLRVLHIITGLDTGGAEMMLCKLVTRGDAGVAHVVLSLAPPGPVASRIREAGIAVHTLGLRGRLVGPWHLTRLRGVVRAVRPDIIQGWLPHGNLAAWVASLRRRVPVIWSVRQSLDDIRTTRWSTRVIIRLGARLSGRPARIVYNSRTGADHHEAAGYSAAKTVVIPNGFDLDRFRPDPVARAEVRRELGLAPDALVVGMVARYHPQKDHGTLLAAASRLEAWGVPARFVLAGRGVDATNVALVRAREAGLGERVLLLGERADVPRLCAALDVAVLSAAFDEGFPNVLGEAMACGVPCVATDVGDSRWILGDVGRIVPPRDPHALAGALRELLELPPDARRALGDRARARIASEFPLDAIGARYERLYHDLAEIAAAR